MSLDILEEYLLIALDDSKGQFVIDSTHLHYGLAGAILLELALREKVSIQGDCSGLVFNSEYLAFRVQLFQGSRC